MFDGAGGHIAAWMMGLYNEFEIVSAMKDVCGGNGQTWDCEVQTRGCGRSDGMKRADVEIPGRHGIARAETESPRANTDSQGRHGGLPLPGWDCRGVFVVGID